MTEKRIHIVQNGAKRLPKSVEEQIVRIEEISDFKVTRFITNSRNHARIYCREHVKSNNIVIAVGGDGTCNEVVGGIMDSGSEKVALGIIPAGTGNDFLRMCKQNSEEQLLDLIAQEDFQPLDLGVVKINDERYYFLNIADLGLGGKVIEIMERQRAIKIGGKFSYASSIIRGFFSYKKPTVKISMPGFSFQGKMMLLGMCNGAVFGHGLTIYPGAKVNDGKLGFTIIGDVTLVDYIRYLAKLKKGLRIDHPEVHYCEGEELELELLGGKIYGETDGEFIPGSACKTVVIPSALMLINPLK